MDEIEQHRLDEIEQHRLEELRIRWARKLKHIDSPVNRAIKDTTKTMTDSRNRTDIFSFLQGNFAYHEIEKTFGKYIYTPLDVPPIRLKDEEKFLDFFFANAKNAAKTKRDFASDVFEAEEKSYLSVDSKATKWDPIWSKNVVESIYDDFPELFEQVHEYMPWIGPEEFKWNIWSTLRDVPPHRDATFMIDAPLAMRVKLYDDNPEESLSLKINPLTDNIDQKQYKWQKLVIPQDTNTFTWNNLRTLHRSKYTPGHRKVLFIWRNSLLPKHYQSFVDLLEKSIYKYKEFGAVFEDSNPPEFYLEMERCV